MKVFGVAVLAVTAALCTAAPSRTLAADPPGAGNMACRKSGFTDFPFCNTSLSTDDRIADLISRINDADKPLLMTARQNQPLDYLGVPAFYFGTNCIHSIDVHDNACITGRCVTEFPSGPNMGATFNPDLMKSMANAIGRELRAMFINNITSSGFSTPGLVCWGPVININRDPRWGRNEDGGPEDPYLMSTLARMWTQGLQNEGKEKYLQAVATLKHMDANTLEKWGFYDRHTDDAKVPNRVLADLYFPAFKAGIREGARGVMCSYNAVQGIPTCLSPLMKEARREWGFKGYVTSDTDSIDDAFKLHKYVPTGEEASCLGVRDGQCDVNSGSSYMKYLLTGVSDGDCSMDDVDHALANALRPRFELGLFDPLDGQPYWDISTDEIGSDAHNNISADAAESSMILLRNDFHSVLPFQPGKHIAVIGPHAEARRALFSPATPLACPNISTADCIESPYEAIKRLNVNGKTETVLGCDLLGVNDTAGFHEAMVVAQRSDYIVLGMGIMNCASTLGVTVDCTAHLEAEAHDRVTIDLPAIQHELIAAIAELGKPTVVFLLNGGAVSVGPDYWGAPGSSADGDGSGVSLAVLEAFYPGPHGAAAIANAIFGKTNRFGKLPYTIYPPDFVTRTPMYEHDPTVYPGRTYRYYQEKPLYPFGYGLSYTNFSLTLVNQTMFGRRLVNRTVTLPAGSQDSLTLKVEVKNVGTITGDEVVQAYFAPQSLPKQPKNKLIQQLFAFERLADVQPGEARTVEFKIDAESLAIVDYDSGDLVSTPGSYEIRITTGVPDVMVTQKMEVTGSETVVDPFPTV